jgi:hypothetical protein
VIDPLTISLRDCLPRPMSWDNDDAGFVFLLIEHKVHAVYASGVQQPIFSTNRHWLHQYQPMPVSREL